MTRISLKQTQEGRLMESYVNHIKYLNLVMNVLSIFSVEYYVTSDQKGFTSSVHDIV